VDGELGKILAAIDAQPRLAGHTAIVLTPTTAAARRSRPRHETGCGRLHHPLRRLVGRRPQARALRAQSADAQGPELANPAIGAEGLPPVRNGEAGNVVLQLLGLPPIPARRSTATGLVLR